MNKIWHESPTPLVSIGRDRAAAANPRTCHLIKGNAHRFFTAQRPIAALCSVQSITNETRGMKEQGRGVRATSN